MACGFADQDDRVARRRGRADHLVQRVQQADRADGRCRQDRGAVRLVVERDIARNDGRAERGASGADAFDAADELSHDLRLFRITEIEIVRRRQWFGAGR